MEGFPVEKRCKHRPAVARGTIKDLSTSIKRAYRDVERAFQPFFNILINLGKC
jgi:hypothetical protein